MKPILEVNNLTKIFMKNDGSQHVAVDHISFSVNEGEVFSFLGPNGAGKSTSINMMTTQMDPTESEIKIDGLDVSQSPAEVRSKIGVVAQHNNLDRGLTAYENLVYHGQYFGMSLTEAKERGQELLKEFGLWDWRDEYVAGFSGGMAQRLKIARAIMHRPKILFLDEPTTGLDPHYRDVLWEHVLKLNKENHTTIFLTTHYMEEPERFSDRVAIYNKGKIKAIGTIDELREQTPGEQAIYMTADFTKKQVEQLIHLDGVLKIHQTDEKSLVIYTQNHSALNHILNFVNQEGMNLTDIQLKQTSLDDIFIYFTTKEEA